MMKTFKTTRAAWGAAGLLASALAVQAAPPTLAWTGGTNWKQEHTIDFATTTAAGRTYDVYSPAAGATNVKAQAFRLGATQMSAMGYCLELETIADGDNSADTRIWMKYVNAGGSTVYKSINDNKSGSTFSKIRVYARKGEQFENPILVAARTSAFNSIPFKLVVRRLDITESACTPTSGTYIPWVKLIGIGSGVNPIPTFSPNAS